MTIVICKDMLKIYFYHAALIFAIGIQLQWFLHSIQLMLNDHGLMNISCGLSILHRRAKMGIWQKQIYQIVWNYYNVYVGDICHSLLMNIKTLILNNIAYLQGSGAADYYLLAS